MNTHTIKYLLLIIGLLGFVPAFGMVEPRSRNFAVSQCDQCDTGLERALQESSLEYMAEETYVDITTSILPEIEKFEKGMQRTIQAIIAAAEKELLSQENVLKALVIDRKSQASIVKIRAVAEKFQHAYLAAQYDQALTIHCQIIEIAQQLAVYKKQILTLKDIKKQAESQAKAPVKTPPAAHVNQPKQLKSKTPAATPRGTSTSARTRPLPGQSTRAAPRQSGRLPQAGAYSRVQAEEFALPPALQHLPGAEIHYFRYNQQQAAQCGSRDVAGTLAIQNLVGHDQPLTAQAIREEAHKLDHILINRDLGGEEVWRLAQAQKVYHCHVLGCTPGTNVIYCNGSTGYFQEWQLKGVLQNVHGNDAVVAHFICNTGTKSDKIGHWVLISIVKQPGQPSLIICLDSMNWPLTNNSRVVTFIRYLHHWIFGY